RGGRDVERPMDMAADFGRAEVATPLHPIEKRRGILVGRVLYEFGVVTQPEIAETRGLRRSSPGSEAPVLPQERRIESDQREMAALDSRAEVNLEPAGEWRPGEIVGLLPLLEVHHENGELVGLRNEQRVETVLPWGSVLGLLGRQRDGEE